MTMLPKSKRGWLSLLVVLFCFMHVSGTETLSFTVRGMSAGKASLTENGYRFVRLLGTANFSPELRLPVQLIYNSASEEEGMFGFGWSVPQLESSAIPQRDGVLWTTPWGEKIRFYASQKADRETLALYREAMKGRDFFSPYADWEADTSARRDFSQSGDWVFTGKRISGGGVSPTGTRAWRKSSLRAGMCWAAHMRATACRK